MIDHSIPKTILTYALGFLGFAVLQMAGMYIDGMLGW